MFKLFIPLVAIIIAILLDYYLHEQTFTWISYVTFFGALLFAGAAVVRAFVNEAREAKARKQPKL